MSLIEKFDLKATLILRAFALLKVPMLGWIKPSVIESSERTVLKIPLGRRTRNHLKSLYFGALCMGAEACVGLTAAVEIQKSGKKVDFVFKDFKANFLKRAEDDTYFICDQVHDLRAIVQKAINSKQREEQRFLATAFSGDWQNPSQENKVAEFEITLSVKFRG